MVYGAKYALRNITGFCKSMFGANAMKVYKIIPGVLVLGCLSLSTAIAAPVDLNAWGEEGPGGGVWTVQGGGDSVFQSVNSSTPTFFISEDPFINSQFGGTIKVEESGGDNDFIGFVFGYTKPFNANVDAATDMDFLLFDWKQGNQDSAIEGFHLSRVTGDFSDNSISHGTTGVANPFWSHVDNVDSNSSFTTLASDTGAGRGWQDNVEYAFELTYQDNLLTVVIDGGLFNDETIFSLAGTYSAGSFGFYNFSQANVRYAGITEVVAPPTGVPLPGSLVLVGAGLLGFRAFSRKVTH